ncbi:four-carbon acid sugar kinase family protein [Sinomonas humi]|uniref:Hrp-dependent type III effector protein n=1 Tax=Sinomonas humi TaxID=1338436 RepID=A0A0B2ANK9_9MICC|nr:four-carbon acid sugar kinase family protein [Sinomonas humi]KHL03534.1 hypothetical protein LK10_08940 [Sinomonas humi]
MPNLVIVADDLTGAADSAVAFAAHSRTAVITNPEAAWPEADVLAVSTESRYLPGGKAQDRARAVAEQAMLSGARVFKKIDSLMRGNVGAEVAGVLEAVSSAKPTLAVVAPAFPRTGRTTVGGVVHVEGAPLAVEGDVVRALGAAGLTTRLISRGDWQDGNALAGLFRAIAEAGIQAAVVDATEEEDLAAIASAAETLGQEGILVGTGGVAAHIGTTSRDSAASKAAEGLPLQRTGGRSDAAGPLVVIGSYSQIGRGQLQNLIANGVQHVELPPLAADDDGRDARAALQQALAVGGAVLTPSLADPLDKSQAARVCAALATTAAAATDTASALVVSGGETAAAVLEAIGAPHFWLRAELLPGVVLADLPGNPIPFVLKSGSFGDAQTLSAVVGRLSHPQTAVPTHANKEQNS